MYGPPRGTLGAFIFLLLLMAKGGRSLYFTQKNYKAEISTDFEAGRNIVKVYALLENEKYRTSNGTHYGFQSLRPCGQLEETRKNPFQINSSSGWISLEKPLKLGLKTGDIQCYLLTVWASDGSESNDTNVWVYVTTISSTLASRNAPCNFTKREIEYICFGLCILDWMILENNRPNTSFAMVRSHPPTHMGCSAGAATYYTVLDPKSNRPHQVIGINRESSELFTINSIDRESRRYRSGKEDFIIKCVIVSKEGNFSATKPAILKVLDVNDNGPLIIKKTVKGTQYKREDTRVITIKEKADIKVGGSLLRLLIHDKDSMEKERDYNVYIVNDPMNQFTSSYSSIQRHFINSVVKWKDELKITGMEYKFDVVFNDTTERMGKNTAIYHIVVKLPFQTRNLSWDWIQSNRTLEVSRAASVYSRIITLYEGGTADPEWVFQISHASSPHPFGVTSPSGIVYVSDRSLMTNTTTKQVNITVQLKTGVSGMRNASLLLTINVNDSEDVCVDARDPAVSCSFQKTPENCTDTCGLGSPKGGCIFKHGDDLGLVSTRGYGTCTPHDGTCPDGICDELEQLEPQLCLQDCVRSKVIGGTLDKGGQGIRVSDTMDCFCRPDLKCECAESSYNLTHLALPQHDPDPGVPPTNKINEKGNITKPADKYVAAPSMVKTNEGSCGTFCKVATTLGVGCTILIVLVAGVLRRYVSRWRRGKRKLKQAGSIVSVSAVPSDYVSESDRSPSSNTVLDGGHPQELQWLGPQIPKGVIDKKWEFSRDDLILEKTLGEGEFGRVLKAQAFSMDGKRGSVTVAVKMLKSCATNSELRDLLSEYQLLKEVSHPNVIKLLGACTESGPFYMIVEFCEHGSLRNYLRESRERDTLYLQDKRSVTSEGMVLSELQTNHELDEDDVISSRDLISFAWQIAKGMQYLSEMKVVHRDLAARNILVSVGKILKISDFGLSRDVYEEETYMKRSKGRVPVKWMAPESLYDHIYTTKSDVWSYGIVLWEIVTLGATPYPGIPPERLFHLLKTGFRMDKPNNCSEEVYQIMSRCWTQEAANRPEFKTLESVFDKMLQENVDYLDLSTTVEHNPILDDDQESSRPNGIGALDRVVRVTTDDDNYGNIHVVQTDDSAYLQPQSVPRNNNTKYFTLLSDSNRLGLMRNGSSPKTSCRSEGLYKHSLLADNVLYRISDSEDNDSDVWESNTLLQVKTRVNSLPGDDNESVGGDSIRSTTV